MDKQNSANLSSKPSWLKIRASFDQKYMHINSLIKEYNLHTVCQEANCPNRAECFSSGTATFLILGPNCTRNCRFCDVTHGPPCPPDRDEPKHVAEAAKILGLSHAVVTSVTRDDLPDGGARQFARVISEIRELMPETTVEVLTPDFLGRADLLGIVLDAGPDIFNHNVETVPRIYPDIRPQADYKRSLCVLKEAGEYGIRAVKSGLMVGLGETLEELRRVFIDLKEVGVNYLTIGQYLAPSPEHFPIQRYYTPDEFNNLAEIARRIGIEHTFSGPLVRSSYHADEQFSPR
jgi:lipoic acid synthetase